MRDRIKNELIIWLQYFFIFFVTCFIASFIREESRHSGVLISSDIEVNINIGEMLKDLWREYFYWYLIAFIALSLVRFSLILLFTRSKKNMK